MRVALAGVIAAALVLPAAQPARGAVVENGQFRLVTDAGNADLPEAIEWKGRPLLDPAVGLGWSFTSFECRSKLYLHENQRLWAAADEPRYVTDVGPLTDEVLHADGFTTSRATYASSFATVDRRIMLHDTEPRLRIEYAFRTSRETVFHETDMFGVTVGFAPQLGVQSVADVRQQPPTRLAGEARGRDGKPAGATYELSLLESGPMMAASADESTTLVVTGRVSGDLPSPVPAKPLVVPEGTRIVFAIDVRIAADAADAERAWEAAVRALTPAHEPYALVRVGDLLAGQGRIAEAEAAYLRAAELDRDYVTPFGRLAGSRRDNPKVPGTITQLDAWIEGAYRQPFNYGYILSGSGITGDKRLTEEQRRLAIFNMLIAVENTQFSPDFYAWAARPFEALGMYAQACAIYRQALWAGDHMPRSEERKAKHRDLCRRKIAELEQKMLGRTITELPPLIPIRIPKEPAAP